MKQVRGCLLLMLVLAVLFASAFSVHAIGFRAEEIYESVFVIYSGNSLGSGFSVGKNCIVTNAHVIASTKSVYVKSYSGEEYRAQILGMNEALDIAVLAVEDVEFPYLPIGDVADMNIGDDIYAIGAPKSMEYTLTKGVISAKEREIGFQTYVQIDAPINEGNSGGPLLNDAGQVLGMNTMKMTDSEGIGLAIPSAVICQYISDLGITLDAAGNVVDEELIPVEEPTEPSRPDESEKTENDVPPVTDGREEETHSRDDQQTEDGEKDKWPPITYAALVIAGNSLVVNVVLIVLLTYRKKKNEPVPYDPSERTDFEIDIWE